MTKKQPKSNSISLSFGNMSPPTLSIFLSFCPGIDTLAIGQTNNHTKKTDKLKYTLIVVVVVVNAMQAMKLTENKLPSI